MPPATSAKAENLSDPDPGSYLYLGAFVDEILVAVLEGGTGRDFTHNGPPTAAYPPPHAYLSLMYVLADHRRAGIGTALLAAFVGRADQAGCSFIKLLVDESDGDSTGRRALFSAAGFTVCGTDPAVNMAPRWTSCWYKHARTAPEPRRARRAPTRSSPPDPRPGAGTARPSDVGSAMAAPQEMTRPTRRK